MSEMKPAQPDGIGKLVLELAGQKPPPDFTDELKKRAKKWLKKWAVRIGAVLTLVASNWVSYHAGAGEDLSGLLNVGAFIAIAVVVGALFNKVK